jgi:hypothetical protein
LRYISPLPGKIGDANKLVDDLIINYVPGELADEKAKCVAETCAWDEEDELCTTLSNLKLIENETGGCLEYLNSRDISIQ